MNKRGKKDEVNYPSKALGKNLNQSVHTTIGQVIDIVASALEPYVQPGDGKWTVFYSQSGWIDDLPLTASMARRIMTKIRKDLEMAF